MAETITSTAMTVNSVWDFILKGGIMMIPIGLCSLVAMAVFMERIVVLRRNRVIPGSFLPGLDLILESQPDDPAEALVYCRESDCPVARVFTAGIRRLRGPIELMEKHIAEEGERESLTLRKNLRVLSVIAAISPLLGLLGTIFGMITAFQTVAVSGEALGKTELLAGGIYAAMITTAAGLIVAIPVLIMYHWLTAKIERLVMEMDRMTVEFIESHSSYPTIQPVDPRVNHQVNATSESPPTERDLIESEFVGSELP